jgi:CRISPR-associated protein Cmr2
MGYLLTIAVGPVQDFIAAARRTRDLWFGSYVLSEISKAVAREIWLAAGGTGNLENGPLIFPAPQTLAELDADSPLNVANKILAELPDNCDSAQVAARAKQAGQKRWQKFASDIERRFANGIAKDIWDEQVDDVLEFYAAWVRYDGHDYKAARERLERLLAGRKSLRDFAHVHGRAGVPKSSLDGARESVLRNEPSVKAQWKFKIKEGEQLDAVGLIKRLAGQMDEKVVSVSRIAVDPWIRRVEKKDKGRELLAAIERLCHSDFAVKLSDPQFVAFPRDGELLLPNRLAVLQKEAEDTAHAPALAEIAKLLPQLIARPPAGLGFGEPHPYLAILCADGDHMGKTISDLTSPQQHRLFSRQLSQFAREARRIVKEHYGYLVYSGGDDVLAFLPLDTCLAAARALHERFGELMREAVSAGEIEQPPTLSVGIGIGHCLETLEDLLHLAQAAEKEAKKSTDLHDKRNSSDERDGLAVFLQTRGSEPIRVRGQWPGKLDERLRDWSEELANSALPDSVPYDLRELHQDYREWQNVSSELLQADVLRLLHKKRSQGRPLSEAAETKLSGFIHDVDTLHRTATELLIARHLARVVYGRI